MNTWGPKPVIFLGGLAILVALSGTRVRPVIVAFLIAAIVFWALQPFKTKTTG